MKLEQQVCTLESAKRLKELGVKQESLFWWSKDKRSSSERLSDSIQLKRIPKIYIENTYSAFTVAELGEMLPESYHSYRTKISGGETKWLSGEFGGAGFRIGDTEAEARAKMLIYLLEQKII